jgi:hypothetical protein
MFLGFYIYEQRYAKDDVPSDVESSLEKPVLASGESVGSSLTEVDDGETPQKAA